jgi:hypothetical protein
MCCRALHVLFVVNGQPGTGHTRRHENALFTLIPMLLPVLIKGDITFKAVCSAPAVAQHPGQSMYFTTPLLDLLPRLPHKKIAWPPPMPTQLGALAVRPAHPRPRTIACPGGGSYSSTPRSSTQPPLPRPRPPPPPPPPPLPRVRSHCRFAPPLIHFIPDALRCSVPLCNTRRMRALPPPPAAGSAFDAACGRAGCRCLRRAQRCNAL